jgi:tetratricopeptide (TPR) repeat protein
MKPLYKNFGVIILASLLMGCSNHQTVAQSEPQTQIVGILPVPTQEKSENQGNFASLPAELMYKVLVAEIASQRGDYVLASPHFFDVAEKTQNVELAERATQTSLYGKNYDLTIKAAHLWLQLNPNNPSAQQILWRVLLHQGHSEQALVHLEMLLDHLKDNPENYLEIVGILLEQHKNQEDALKFIEKLAERRPKDSTVLLIQARILLNLNQMDSALTVLQQLLKITPNHPQGVLLYAHLLEKQDKIKEGLKWMEQALAKTPDNQTWRLFYAQMLANNEQYERAIVQFRRLLSKDPQNPETLFALGILSLQVNKIKQARNYFMTLLNNEEQAEVAYYYLGQLEEEEKRPNKAIDWYNKISVGPNYLKAQARIVSLLAAQDRLEEAIAQLRAIPVQNKEDALTLTQFEAELYIERQRYPDAMDVYNKAIKADVDNTDLLYMRAMLADKMNQFDLLERDLRRLLELDPKHVQALNALGYALADQTQRYTEAYELIKKALELSPNEYYILDSVGWVLYRMGQYPQAIEYLQKAKSLQDDPEIAAHLGEVLWVNGNQEEARKIWKEALKKFPTDAKLLETVQRLSK